MPSGQLLSNASQSSAFNKLGPDLFPGMVQTGKTCDVWPLAGLGGPLADGLRLDKFRLETCTGFQGAVARLAAVSFHAADNGIRLQHGAVPHAPGHSGLSSHGAVSGVLPSQTPWPDEASKDLAHIATTWNTHPRTMPRKGAPMQRMSSQSRTWLDMEGPGEAMAPRAFPTCVQDCASQGHRSCRSDQYA